MLLYMPSYLSLTALLVDMLPSYLSYRKGKKKRSEGKKKKSCYFPNLERNLKGTDMDNLVTKVKTSENLKFYSLNWLEELKESLHCTGRHLDNH